MPEVIGEYVDRLCNVEMRMKGLPRGVAHLLYDRARQAQDGPLTYLAARHLLENVREDGRVMFLTGAGLLPWLPQGETDGPLGAVCLARALSVGLGAKAIYVSEERHLPPINAASVAAGISVVDATDIQVRKRAAVAVPFPLGDKGAKRAAQQLLDDYQPTAVIAVEKLGPNEKGVLHSIAGVAVPPQSQAHTHYLIEEAKQRGILTIGIGDGGNEIGFGLITEAVQEIQPYGRHCQCPCDSGVATVTSTDVLVCAAVSNWGAYGVAACMAFMLGDPNVLHDEHTEYRMLDAAVGAGALDGAYGVQSLLVDGIGWRAQQALITMLHSIVENGLTEISRSF
jgi:hypothetical protein